MSQQTAEMPRRLVASEIFDNYDIARLSFSQIKSWSSSILSVKLFPYSVLDKGGEPKVLEDMF